MALLTILPIFGYALWVYSRYGRRISSAIFFAITFMLTALYLFGLANLLPAGAYLLFYAGIALLAYFVCSQTAKVLAVTKTVPVVVFTVSAVLYLYLFRDAKYFFWDEYSHWGVYIKEMMYTHHLYDAESISAHLRYPPGAPVWQYFVAVNTGYSEASTYFATFLLLLCSTLVLYEQLSWKQVHWIAAILAAQTLILADFGHGLNSIYVDHVIGSIFAGLVLNFLAQGSDRRAVWLFAFPVTSIVLVKDVGLYFGVAAVGLFLLLAFFSFRSSSASFVETLKQNRRLHVTLIGLLLLSAATPASWNLRQDLLGVAKEKQSVSGIVKSIATDEQVLSPDVAKTVKERFWQVFFNQQIHKAVISLGFHEFSYQLMDRFTSPVKFTTFTILLFAFFMFAANLLISIPKEIRLQIALTGLYLLAVTLFYLAILYASYLVAFKEDALRIPSYVRYANISIMPLLYIAIGLFLPTFHNPLIQVHDQVCESRKAAFIALLGFLIVLGGVTKPYLKPLYSPMKNYLRGEIDAIASSILEKIPEQARLFIVFPFQENGYERYVLKFLFLPAKSTISSYDFLNLSNEEILNAYAQYDYVWFSIIDQAVMDKNRTILRRKDRQQFFGLYEVESNGRQVHFNPVL